MSFLPDIDENGQLVNYANPKLYVPPKYYYKQTEEERLKELNNLGHDMVTEDFSDSPHLNT